MSDRLLWSEIYTEGGGLVAGLSPRVMIMGKDAWLTLTLIIHDGSLRNRANGPGQGCEARG